MDFSPGWLLLLALLATARVTRLVTTDAILDRPRAWLQSRGSGNLTYLVTCPWCLSIYFGAATAAAVHWAGRAWWVQVPLLGLAISYTVGLLEQAVGLVTARHELAEAMTAVERIAAAGHYDSGGRLRTGVGTVLSTTALAEPIITADPPTVG